MLQILFTFLIIFTSSLVLRKIKLKTFLLHDAIDKLEESKKEKSQKKKRRNTKATRMQKKSGNTVTAVLDRLTDSQRKMNTSDGR